ncbi:MULTISPECIES: outer membrane protein assembly factor BamD [unclassified Lentimonas]|uniref:outer membrane protein assembly factor BamD n=1 Tax=unclassified Lentimonas TaxID=2630993 RepID=UPI0013270313|nr:MULTISPECIES: outer membrane protein assembly factor BamD [unclassified Lentimonas]CAA6695387.1 TPR domain protein, putative component of TonB system [Lentimonas sp. CC10]CAA6695796.1 TPR domain protein, putative component of TonB system [Lentimonas sp. CC19]CAA7072036.1 TPR domain protein, putative component of TonB system [Lentimonas sp. CC11]
MHRSFPLLLALGLLLAPSLNAASLNPFNWFGGSSDANSIDASSEVQDAAAKLLAVAKEKYDAGNLSSARRTLKKIIKKYPASNSSAEALMLRANIYMEQERWTKGFDDLQDVIVKHADYPNFDRVIADQFDCATALMEGARGRILWVFPGFKQYGTSAKQFEQIVLNAPYNDYAPLALMNVALVSEKTGESEQAIDALDRLINYYPQSMLAPDAYYNLAQTYSDLVQSHEYDQGSTRRAISYYEDFLILFPASNYTGEVEANLKNMENQLASSRLYIGDFYYYYRNNNTAALVFYNEAITTEPDSDAAEEAALRIADIEAGVRPTNKASIVRKLLGAE